MTFDQLPIRHQHLDWRTDSLVTNSYFQLPRSGLATPTRLPLRPPTARERNFFFQDALGTLFKGPAGISLRPLQSLLYSFHVYRLFSWLELEEVRVKHSRLAALGCQNCKIGRGACLLMLDPSYPPPHSDCSLRSSELQLHSLIESPASHAFLAAPVSQ